MFQTTHELRVAFFKYFKCKQKNPKEKDDCNT